MLATQERFDPGTRTDSVFTEALGLLRSLIRLSPELTGQTVRWRTDNVSSYFLIRNGGGSSSDLNIVAKKVFLVCAAAGIDLQAEHISGTAVIRAGADALSRDLDTDDQRLAPSILAQLLATVGPLEFDLFACPETALAIHGRRLPFYSRFVHAHGLCRGVDALAMPWPDRAYGFPPASIAFPTVQRALASSTSCTLILPRWPSQPWWSLLVGHPRVAIYDLGPAADAIRPGPSGRATLIADPVAWQALRLVAVHVLARPGACPSRDRGAVEQK